MGVRGGETRGKRKWGMVGPINNSLLSREQPKEAKAVYRRM